MTKPVKWGIISTADINRKVIPGAHASDKVDLVAVASRDQARADEYATAMGDPARIRLLRGPARRSGDRGGLHLAAEHDALPNGRSARSRPASTCSARSRSRAIPDEVAAAFDTADRIGLHLSEAFMYRHNPQTKRLKELVDGRRDRRAAPRALGVQLLALRPRQHPPAHRCRGRRADGRRLLQRLAARACSAASPSGPSARRGSARRAPTGCSRGHSGSRTT